MKVYFYFSVHEPLFLRVAEELQRHHGVRDVGGFVYGLDQARWLAENGFRPYRLDVYSEWLDPLGDWKVNPAYLEEAERKYGHPTLASMMYTDRHLLKRPAEEIPAILELTARRAEKVFQSDPPDALVMESVSCLADYMLWAVARHHGVRVLLVDAGRIPGRALVYDNPQQRWSSVEDTFEKMRRRDLQPEERSAAEEFVAQFRQRRPRLFRMGPQFLPSLSHEDLRRFARWWRRWMQDPRNITLRSPVAMTKDRALRVVRYRAARFFRLFEEPVAGEAYVLFPLQLQPESTTSVCAPMYMDQVGLVEDLARCMPAGWKLYVKEHFASIGRRPLMDYRRMSRLWNVRLIRPDCDGLALVQDARAVATVSSTMGWEAAMIGKAVVTFGEAFYNALPSVFRAGSLPKADLPFLFRRIKEGYQPDEEILLKFVAAILRETTETRIIWDNPWTRYGVLDDENVRNIAELLARQLFGTQGAPILMPLGANNPR